MISYKSISAKFRRAKTEAIHTFLWEDVPEERKNIVNDFAIPERHEVFIIYYYESEDYSLLLTTQRIVTLSNGTVYSYHYDQLNMVTIDDIFDEKESKSENQTLTLTTKSHEKIVIKVEKGTWPILYTIVKLLISQFKLDKK